MECEEIIRLIRAQGWYENQIAALRVVAARRTAYGECDPPLSPTLRRTLEQAGIKRLWSHQAQAIDLLRRAENTAVVTSAASGKTLCYLIPILEALEANPRACSLLIYPTKALAQDQLRKTAGLLRHTSTTANVYDGDTPASRRPAIRKSSQLIYTNPDMLHQGILPNHPLWATFFSNLRFVVLDEVHTYRGVFGSHVAALLRRLRRVCSHYGSQPVFACCSATVANPKELVTALTGLPFQIVDQDGSPSGRKYFILWNPAAGPDEGGTPNTEATHLLTFFLREGVRSIVFVRARVVAELILRYVKNVLRRRERELGERLMAYRAGYLPEQRRDIERRLFQGDLLGVVATTALEVGVDIGGLEATVMVGYPQTIASTWQQAGRSGRGTEDSLALLILAENALEQYILTHPDYLFQTPSEKTLVSPENRFVLAGHLLCAAYEAPLAEKDLEFFPHQARELLPLLEQEGYLKRRGGKVHTWHWSGSGFPAEEISIRSASGKPFSIRLADSGEELGSVDADRAFYHVHPGAIYLHQGESYLVEDLDLSTRTAMVRPVQVDYYTQPMSHSEVRLGEIFEEKSLGAVAAQFGEAQVSETVVAYRRRRQYTGETLAYEPLTLPPSEYDSLALWLTFPAYDAYGRGLSPRPAASDTSAARFPFDSPQARPPRAETGLALPPVGEILGALHAMEHCMIAVLPLFASCDPFDLGGLSHLAHPDTGAPTIIIYDGYPGGIGLAERGFEILPELLRATRDTIAACACESGCPRCVQSPRCGDNNEPLDKAGALAILEQLCSVTGV